jgi:hypothetical protein
VQRWDFRAIALDVWPLPADMRSDDAVWMNPEAVLGLLPRRGSLNEFRHGS